MENVPFKKLSLALYFRTTNVYWFLSFSEIIWNRFSSFFLVSSYIIQEQWVVSNLIETAVSCIISSTFASISSIFNGGVNKINSPPLDVKRGLETYWRTRTKNVFSFKFILFNSCRISILFWIYFSLISNFC